MQRIQHVAIERLPSDFNRWRELLALIRKSFAYMDGFIDPPSSARLLTADSLREKAEDEICFLALDKTRLAGCVFAAERGDALYIGKLAADPTLQRLGIGRALMQAVESLASQMGKPALELQTRVELLANHATFRRMGFVEVGRTAHPGFDRPTSITFRKRLA
jgi:GNAT superfamily N-acetyltransferase